MTLAYGSKEYGFRDQILVDTIQPDIDAKAEASIEKWTAKIEEIKAKIGKDNSEAEAAPSEENAGSEKSEDNDLM